MLKRYIILMLVITVIIMAVSYTIFWRALTKETAPSVEPEEVSEGAAPEYLPLASYDIPASTIPSIQSIEESIKKTNEAETLLKETIKEREKKRQERLQRKVMPKQDEPAAPAKVETGSKTVVIPSKKEVVFPTREERKQMESSRGIITY